LRDYVDGCSGQLKARRTRKRVDGTQPAVGEDEAPVNAPKWTTAGYKGSLKSSVAKYTRRNITSSPEPMTTPASPIVTPIPSTAPVDETAAGPSTATAVPFTSTAEDVFFLNEDILKDDNVLDIGGDEEDDGSSEDDSSESSSEEESR
jgi:hypothetical protein